MEQLAAAAAAQGSDFGGVGGHPLAGGPASRTEHGERTARLPAGALNPSVHPAEAPVPPSGGGPGPLRDRGSGSPTPAGRRGTVPSRSSNPPRESNASALAPGSQPARPSRTQLGSHSSHRK
ncbi:homeobox protein Hox-D8-like isoform X2 [Psammomys obesus]|uniref:homeobox protein Hox-D8-like isoform X2 n=1 Tax=Psammomys obesus TaxID=48139 RepID=UPI002452E022|nr:homeobox protein Hox-D8-like isoform X2 [Psammomys obesus]